MPHTTCCRVAVTQDWGKRGKVGFIACLVDAEDKEDIPKELRTEMKKAGGRWNEEGGGYTFVVGQQKKLYEGLSTFAYLGYEDLTKNHSTSIFGSSDHDLDARDKFVRREKKRKGGSRSSRTYSTPKKRKRSRPASSDDNSD